jgi:solute carrier family 10 (sodium/bile acid cotransporter), member 7
MRKDGLSSFLMRAFLARRWFLLVLGGGVALALFRPEVFLIWTSRLIVPVFVGAALFLMGWTLPSRSLGREITRPWPALWALVLSYGLLPAGAWLFGQFLPRDYRVGLLLVASGPCTLASAVLWTRMSGGNDATALLVIFLSTASSWLVTTVWLTLGTGSTLAGGEITGMMLVLLLTLVVPVGLGQLCRAYAPMLRAAHRFRAGINVLSQLIILIIVFKASADVGARLAQEAAALDPAPFLATALSCFGLHVGTLTAGFWTSRWFGCDRPRQLAVAFACSQKTLPVAVVLFEGYFQNDFPLALIPVLLYHVGQLILDTVIAEFLKAHNVH